MGNENEDTVELSLKGTTYKYIRFVIIIYTNNKVTLITFGR